MRIVILIAILITLALTCFAQENISTADRIIGSTFKVLAKGFVEIADINKLKNNIDRINKMSEDKFKKRYTEAYKVIKDLPPELKLRYGITEATTKEQIIKDIDSLDKSKIYEIIDSIPDEIIAKQFKQYLSEKKEEIQKSNIVEQINKFWNKMINNVSSRPKVTEHFKLP